ncbi:hypothetical protein [Gracilibacillus caseinilyticus]|nr:hypothetical protein [Gracilibacillus caseinilyticus]
MEKEIDVTVEEEIGTFAHENNGGTGGGCGGSCSYVDCSDNN